MRSSVPGAKADVDVTVLGTFLDGVVLGSLPAPIRDFLLEICLLPRHVTLALAAAATGRADAADLLADLQRRHLIEPHATTGGPAWDVTAVIRDHGRRVMPERRPARAREVCLAGAAHLTETGRYGDGIALALRSGDEQAAVARLLRNHLAMTIAGEGDTLHGILMPLIAAGGPHLAELHVVASWATLLSGQLALADQHARLAERPAGVDERSRLINAEVLSIRAQLAQRAGHPSTALERVQQAMALLADVEAPQRWILGSALHSRGQLDIGMAAAVAGEVELALDALQAVAASKAPAAIRALSHSYLGLLSWLRDDPDLAGHVDLVAHLDPETAARTLRDLTYNLTLAFADPTADGARALRAAEIIAASQPDTVGVHLVLLARACRLGRRDPVEDALVEAYPTQCPVDDGRRLLAVLHERIDAMEDPGVLPAFLQRVRDAVGDGDARVGEPLTESEAQLLRMLSGTLTEREIAAEMYLAHSTIRTYRRRLYRKLGVTSRRAAVEAWRARD